MQRKFQLVEIENEPEDEERVVCFTNQIYNRKEEGGSKIFLMAKCIYVMEITNKKYHSKGKFRIMYINKS